VELRERLLEVLASAWQFERDFIESATPEEQTRSGSADNWTAKDIIAHVAEWNARLAQTLREVGPDQEPPVYGEVDEENAAIFESYRSVAWLAIIDRLNRGHLELEEYVRTAPRLALTDPVRNPQRNEL